jgi:hypothetical protein
MVIECTSPRTTALNQTVQWSPITTSPTTVAFSAKKQSDPKIGVKPLIDFIIAIRFPFGESYNAALEMLNLPDKMSHGTIKVIIFAT